MTTHLDDDPDRQQPDRRKSVRTVVRWPVLALAGIGVLVTAYLYIARSDPSRGSAGATSSVPAGRDPAPLAVRVAEGESLWGQFCAACHVVPAWADSALAPVLLSREYLEYATDARLDSVIARGVAGTTMTGWGAPMGPLSPTQVQHVIDYMRSRQPTAPSDPRWKGSRRVPIP